MIPHYYLQRIAAKATKWIRNNQFSIYCRVFLLFCGEMCLNFLLPKPLNTTSARLCIPHIIDPLHYVQTAFFFSLQLSPHKGEQAINNIIHTQDGGKKEKKRLRVSNAARQRKNIWSLKIREPVSHDIDKFLVVFYILLLFLLVEYQDIMWVVGICAVVVFVEDVSGFFWSKQKAVEIFLPCI